VKQRLLYLALLLLSTSVHAANEQRFDQLVWDYAQFVEEFRAENWEGGCAFVAELPR